MPSEDSQRYTDKDSRLANVALLYYGEGLTQSEIAKRLGVSRATVVNMLRECRERGIVEIRVDGEVLAGSNLSRALCERFGLVDAYVARSRHGNSTATRAENLGQVARVGAMALQDLVRPKDMVGVAWGETIKAVSSAMGHTQVPDVTVCQMIGSMVSDRVPASEDCAIRIAHNLGAQCFTLHAPAVLSSHDLSQALRAEPTIAAQLDRLASLDLAVFSVGNTNADTHLVGAGIADDQELQVAVDAGAVGIVCCRYFDEHGKPLPMPPEERVIAITMDQLRRTERKLLIVAGDDRLAAVLAALRGGLVTHLCVDEDLAQLLLNS